MKQVTFLPQMIVMGIIFTLWWLFFPKIALLSCFITYFLLSFVLKESIPRDHNRGMRKLRNGDYAGAIEAFEKSLEFFNKHPWIDTHRAFTILSFSEESYREMATRNIAICSSMIENKKITK